MSNTPTGAKSAARTSTMNAPATAASTTSAPAVAEERYKTMIIGIGKSHEAEHKALSALADKLGVKPGALVWHAIAALLATPPKQGDVKVTASAIGIGTAPGFWVVPGTDAAGKATSIAIVEVSKRADANGRAFFRFTAGETPEETAKARDRALKQATRAAEYDAKLLGLKVDSKVVKK